MANVKQQVLELIQGLPETVSYDQIMEQLYFSRKLETGLMQLDQGQGIEHAEALSRLSQWLKP